MMPAPAEKWVVMITAVTADNSCWLSSTGGAKIRSWIQDTIPDVVIIPQSGISETTILQTKRSFWRHTCFISTLCFFFPHSSSWKKDMLMFRSQRAITLLLLLQDVMWLNINLCTVFKMLRLFYKINSNVWSESLHVWVKNLKNF